MTKLHFTAATDATQALDAMRARHDDAGPEAADIVIALGGDGFMLQTLHTFTDKGKPIYGMNLGSVGFLMNEYRQEDLLKRLAAAEKAEIAAQGRFKTGETMVVGPDGVAAPAAAPKGGRRSFKKRLPRLL